jgi:hypothetical protein
MSARGRRLKVVPKARGKKAADAVPVLTLAEQAEKLKDLVEESGALFGALAEMHVAYEEAVDDLVKAKTGKTIFGDDGLVAGDAAAWSRMNGRDMAFRVLRDTIEARTEVALVKAKELHARIKTTTPPADARPKRKAVA